MRGVFRSGTLHTALFEYHYILGQRRKCNVAFTAGKRLSKLVCNCDGVLLIYIRDRFRFVDRGRRQHRQERTKTNGYRHPHGHPHDQPPDRNTATNG
jgi:hypothetical protein